MNEKIENQKFILNRLDGFIESSQNKSNLYIALNVAILGGIITLLSALKVKEFECVLVHILILVSIMAIVSLLIILLLLNPYLKSSLTEEKSLFFFRDIADESPNEYNDRSASADELSIMYDLSSQIHSLSSALSKKYSKLCIVGWVTALEFIFMLIWIIIFLTDKF